YDSVGRIQVAGSEYMKVLVRLPDIDVSAILVTKIDTLFEPVRRHLVEQMILSGVIIIFIFIVAYFLSMKELSFFQSLKKLTLALKKQDYSVRLPGLYRDERREITRSL